MTVFGPFLLTIMLILLKPIQCHLYGNTSKSYIYNLPFPAVQPHIYNCTLGIFADIKIYIYNLLCLKVSSWSFYCHCLQTCSFNRFVYLFVSANGSSLSNSSELKSWPVRSLSFTWIIATASQVNFLPSIKPTTEKQNKNKINLVYFQHTRIFLLKYQSYHAYSLHKILLTGYHLTKSY